MRSSESGGRLLWPLSALFFTSLTIIANVINAVITKRTPGFSSVYAGGLENARMQEDSLALIFSVSRAGAGPVFYRIAPPDEL